MMDEPSNVREERQSEVGNGCLDGGNGSTEARRQDEGRDDGMLAAERVLLARGLLQEGGDWRLTDVGRKVLAEQALRPEVETPSWDADQRVLRWRGQGIKTFERAAPDQWAVFEEFQRQHWPRRINDPLEPDRFTDCQVRLRELVRRLNMGLEPGTIRFRSDGTGRGIRWEVVSC